MLLRIGGCENSTASGNDKGISELIRGQPERFPKSVMRLSDKERVNSRASPRLGGFQRNNAMRPMRAPYRPFDSESEKPAPINWRRGMFRIWVLASAAWIMGWVLYLLIDGLKVGFSVSDLLVVAVVLLGPPLALLLFGIATRWAFQGFTAEDSSPKA